MRHYKQVSSNSNISTETLQYQAEFEFKHKNKTYEPGENNTPLNLPFSIFELKTCINQRRDTAAGRDVLSYQMFKHLPDSVLAIWLRLYNMVWSGGIYPNAWKEACVIPLHKNGKDKNDPKSYRPISLTSHCLREW